MKVGKILTAALIAGAIGIATVGAVAAQPAGPPAGYELQPEHTKTSADGATNEKVDRSAAWVAAACLHFCFANRIPVPRQATKRIEPIEGGLQLVIEMTISVVGTIDSSSDRTGTPPRSSIQEAAANEVPSSAVAEPAKA